MLCFLLCKKQRCWTFSKGKCSAPVKCYKCIWFCCVWCFLCCPLSNISLCWTFFFGKCDAEHFLLENVRQNAFWHQMHFCIKCIFAQRCWTFSFGKCTLNIFLWKMYALQKCIFASNAFCRFLTFCKQNVRAASLFFAKQKTQHFGIKCIFASNAFLHQMHFCNAPAKCKGTAKAEKCCVFCFAKSKKTKHSKKQRQCVHFVGAEHLPKENVQQSKMLQMLCFLLCKKQRCRNVFGAEMYLVQKCIWCRNVFDAKMHFCIKCIFASNAFLCTFSFGKCTLCKNIFDAKMHLVQKCIWCKNAFLHQMHFCIKCIFVYIFLWKMYALQKYIWCKNAFDAALTFCLQNVRKRQNAFDAKMHFCNAYIFQRKMFSCAKMLCFLLCKKQRCCAKMHFCKTKCTHQMHLMLPLHFVGAEHFPKENVQVETLITRSRSRT